MNATTGARPGWALAVAGVALGAAGWLLVTSAAPSGDASVPATSMLDVAPGGTVALAGLPTDHQHLYRAAEADPDAFTQVRCYCGCEAFLDHRHLADCFVRPDGGWERHATGCAVCLAEAERVIELRGGGVPVPEIVAEIDRTFGAITTPDDA